MRSFTISIWVMLGVVFVLLVRAEESASEAQGSIPDSLKAGGQTIPIESVADLRKVKGFENVSLRLTTGRMSMSDEPQVDVEMSVLEIVRDGKVLFGIASTEMARQLEFFTLSAGHRGDGLLNVGYVIDGEGNACCLTVSADEPTAAFKVEKDMESGRWRTAQYTAQTYAKQDRRVHLVDIDFDGYFDAKNIFSAGREEQPDNYIYKDGAWKEVDVFLDAAEFGHAGKIVNRRRIFYEYDEEEGWKVGKRPVRKD